MRASQMFAELHVPTSQAVIRNLIFKFMYRLEKSENCILNNLVESTTSDTRFFSKIGAHWKRYCMLDMKMVRIYCRCLYC